MSYLRWLAVGLIAICSSAAAGEITDPYCPFVFNSPADWEQTQSEVFTLTSPDGAELTGMPIPDSAHGEPLDQVDQKASYFHNISFGGANSSTPEQVSGAGWTGLLRKQNTPFGVDFQFVVRSERATCLYYLRVPEDVAEARSQELRQLLLSARAAGPKS